MYFVALRKGYPLKPQQSTQLSTLDFQSIDNKMCPILSHYICSNIAVKQ